MSLEDSELALLFEALGNQHDRALESLMDRLHHDLRRAAHGTRLKVSADSTLSTTALISELYLKLQRASKLRIADRKHFLVVAAQAMRQILIDQARSRLRQKALESAQHSHALASADDEWVLQIADALDRLRALQPRLAQVCELRFFAGLTETEIATVLDSSTRTVRRDWEKARAWLLQVL